MTGVPPGRSPEAGVTLVEVLVALALFALIGMAGFAVVDQVIRVQQRTEGRLQHLAELQRAMHLITRDFMQASDRSLDHAGGAVVFRRSAPGGELAARYGLEGSTLVRRVYDRARGSRGAQALLSGIEALTWSFYDPTLGWADRWPVDPTLSPPNPAAVRLDASIDGPGLTGRLSRIALLPAEPRR